MNATTATLLLVAAWLLVGTGVGLALTRRGQPASAALTAVAAWPVLLPVLFDGAPPVRPAGPFADRIAACFASLRNALADPAAHGVVTPEELVSLQEALNRADGRIGMVDRMLGEEALRGDPLADQLVRARGFAADEIEGVLRGVVQLRVQVGLVALAGDTLPVKDRMRELRARVHAIEEISLA
jgi:hypothetical protein